MCDASDYVVQVVKGQKKDKKMHAIYYASRALNEAHVNYSTTEKELLAIVFIVDKFRRYLVGSTSIINIIHSANKKFVEQK